MSSIVVAPTATTGSHRQPGPACLSRALQTFQLTIFYFYRCSLKFFVEKGNILPFYTPSKELGLLSHLPQEIFEGLLCELFSFCPKC